MTKDSPFTPATVEEQIAEIQKCDQTLADTPNQHLIQQLQLLYQPYKTNTDHVKHAFEQILQKQKYKEAVSELSIQKADKPDTAKARIFSLKARWLTAKRLSIAAAVVLLGAVLSGSFIYTFARNSGQVALSSTPTSLTTAISSGEEVGIDPEPILYQNTLYVYTEKQLRAYSTLNGTFERAYPLDNLTIQVIFDGVLYGSNTTSLFALRLSDGKMLWQVPFSLSSLPIIENGILYASVSSPNQLILAVQISDGKVLWEYGINNGYKLTSAPVIMQGNVYFSSDVQLAHSIDVEIYSLNATTSSLNWQQSFGNTIISNLKTNGSALFVLADGSVESLNAHGTVLWKSQLPQQSQIQNYGEYIAAISNGTFYAVENRTLYAISTSNGAILWSFQAPFGTTYGTLSLNSDILFVGIGNLSVNQNDPCTLLALNASKGNLIWQKQLSNAYQIPHPAAAQGKAYVAFYHGGAGHYDLSALNGTNGQQIWTASID